MIFKRLFTAISLCAAFGAYAAAAETESATGNMNAYFEASATSWSSVNAYFWDAGNANKEYLGKWPGTALTLLTYEGVQYYHMSFSTSDVMVKPMVIFNSADGLTSDFDFVNDGVYDINGFTGRWIKISSGAVENVAADSLSVSGRSIAAAGLIEVYSLQGIEVARGQGSVEVPSSGMYIVKTASAVLKMKF